MFIFSFLVIFFVILVSNLFSTWWYFQAISIPFVRNWMKSKDLFWNPRYINSKLVYINEKWSTSMKGLITTYKHSGTLTQKTLPSSMSGNMSFDVFWCFFDVFWCLGRPQIDSGSIWDDLRIVHFLSFSVIFFVILVSNSFSKWWYFQPISIPFVRNWMKLKDLFWNPRCINSKLIYINEKWSTSMKPLITTYKHSGTLTQKTLPSSMSGNLKT